MMKTLLCVMMLCAMVGCATTGPQHASLDDAIRATSELNIGMSAPDVLRLLSNHCIEPSYSCGGPSPYGWTAAKLDDRSRLFLWFDYRDRETNKNAPGILAGWSITNPAGDSLENYSKAPPFAETERTPQQPLSPRLQTQEAPLKRMSDSP